MCDVQLSTKGRKQKFGYKIVLKQDGKYFSPAMGCEYPMKGKIKQVKVQTRLSTYFYGDILAPGLKYGFSTAEQSGGYRREMVGNTGVFVYKFDAQSMCDLMSAYEDDPHTYSVVKARVYGTTFDGMYDGVPVVLGNHIEFIDE